MKVSFSDETLVFALGGLGEVGKNMYCIEHKDSIFIIDSGVKFPEADLLGIDYVIPDYTYLSRNQYKIKALFITHGHEDHIGGISFLLKKINVPLIYAPKLARALMREKLKDAKMDNQISKIVEFDEDTKPIKFGEVEIDFVTMTHSTPDSFGIRFKTPNGVIFTTGDFKVDLTPVSQNIDLTKLAEIGKEGVDLLLADSTNAEASGHTVSESDVVTSIDKVFEETPGRLIIATFSSNLYRIQQLVETAVRYKRKIVVFGRSMEQAINIGRECGYILAPDNYFISAEAMKTVPHINQVVLCTGSQGEPMAALSRIALDLHKTFKIYPGDTVVFSSNPIPGNQASVNKVINNLIRKGATVLTNTVFKDLHASGHAQQEELKLIQKLVKPKFFMPVHGEYRMLKIHSELAYRCGLEKEHAFVLRNGDVLRMNDGKVYQFGKVETDDIFIDGNDISGLSTAVIKDRSILASDGIIACMVSLNSRDNSLDCLPQIINRGFIFEVEGTKVKDEAIQLVNDELTKLLVNKVTFSDIKNTIRNTLSKFVFDKTHRSPMIIPVVLNRRSEDDPKGISFKKKRI